jgi:hypothetical protein
MTQAQDSSERAQLSDDTIDAVSKALRRAWELGQTYWQQADSDYWKQQDLSVGTQQKFEMLIDETSALLAADGALTFESALAELVNKIDTSLDSGDLLTDARRASTAIDAILTKGDLVANACDYFRDSPGRYENSVEFNIGWNACLDAICSARAVIAADRATAPVSVAQPVAWVVLDDAGEIIRFSLSEDYSDGLPWIPLVIATHNAAQPTADNAPQTADMSWAAIPDRSSAEDYVPRVNLDEGVTGNAPQAPSAGSVARNVDGKTRAEFEAYLRVCFQHDNVRAKERGLTANERTLADQEKEIKERVQRNYPDECPGCHAWDSGLSEVNFVQGCPGCAKRMRIANGHGTATRAQAKL